MFKNKPLTLSLLWAKVHQILFRRYSRLSRSVVMKNTRNRLCKMYGLPPTRTGLHYRLFLRLLVWALLLTASWSSVAVNWICFTFGGVGRSAVSRLEGISLVIGYQKGRPFRGPSTYVGLPNYLITLTLAAWNPCLWAANSCFYLGLITLLYFVINSNQSVNQSVS